VQSLLLIQKCDPPVLQMLVHLDGLTAPSPWTSLTEALCFLQNNVED
jgi:hypothetical protein